MDADPYEPNNTMGTAFIFPVAISVNAANASFIPSGTDVDWFAFYVKSGRHYRAMTSNLSGVDTYMEVFDESGNRIAHDDDSGGGFASKVEWQAAYNGYYYIKVSNLVFISPPNNTYNLLIAETGVTITATPFQQPPTPTPIGTPPPGSDPYEPNNSRETAYVFPPAIFVSAPSANFVPSATDVDWFAFYVKSGQGYWAVTSNLSGVDTYLKVFNEDGDLVAYDDDSGGGFASKVEWHSVYKGYYYIRVSNLVSTSSSWDTYDVSMAEIGVTATATPTPTPSPTPMPPISVTPGPTSPWPTPTALPTPTWMP
jgi:hypothetical protein